MTRVERPMTTDSTLSLYTRVVRVTHVYLGPAAERFIGRQVRNHLNKNPETLSKDDLNKLITWIKVAVGVLTEDNELVEEYIGHLQRLASSSHTSKDV